MNNKMPVQIYDSFMNIFYWNWNDVPECSTKRSRYIRLKTFGIIHHDRVLLALDKLNETTEKE